MKMILLCFGNTLLMVTGQILFKIGSTGKNIDNIFDIIKLFFTPIVFFALCLYACTTGLWLYILSKIPISFAYPIQALAFPIVLFASMFLFKEEIPISRWIGIIFICVGVFISTKA
ncbi:EamA family transporter [Clostridium beijerinckii]|uniref:EamA family transporter n=1 Tax=Clostridium beijerinckii TaxID=1520 RepID=UPI00242DFB64|nr:EamA family transporter [Clostridium beijerinckii]MDG5852749.1 EamA family transporter [Clostridium beijerinckii]